MAHSENSPADPRDWMTPVITFTLIPATVHFGLLVWLLNQGDRLSVWGDALMRLLLVGSQPPAGLFVVLVMNAVYFSVLVELCRRTHRPPPPAQLLLGLIYPAPVMAAATLFAMLGRIF